MGETFQTNHGQFGMREMPNTSQDTGESRKGETRKLYNNVCLYILYVYTHINMFIYIYMIP